VKRSDARAGLGAVLLLLLAALPARAQECTGISTSPVAFGAYDRFSGPLDATGSVSVTCTLDLPFQVELTAGGGAAFDPRRMQHDSGPYQLAYNLFLDPARSVIWGDGTGGTQVYDGVGNGATLDVTVYGRIPASQSVGVGSYSDTVAATVLW
jgi:spore coat protein U-like protein